MSSHVESGKEIYKPNGETLNRVVYKKWRLESDTEVDYGRIQGMSHLCMYINVILRHTNKVCICHYDSINLSI